MNQRMKNFCHIMKNMFLPIREGLAEAKVELGRLRHSNARHESFLSSLGYFLGVQVAKHKGKETKARRAKRQANFMNEECQTNLEPGGKSTPEPRKRPRELIESTEEPGTKKPEEKRPKAFNKEEEWVEVLGSKKTRKKIMKKSAKNPERPRRARAEVVLIKSAEGMNNCWNFVLKFYRNISKFMCNQFIKKSIFKLSIVYNPPP